MAGDVAIVTGSTAGLGKEIARLFAAEGALVVVTGRNRERGEAIAAELRASSGEASFVAADLTVDDDAYALIDAAIARYGALHVLVNNAVSPEIIARDGKAADVSNEVWESMLRVNVLGPAWLLQKAIPQMLEQRRGSIVNISSRTAERASPRLAAPSAAVADADTASAGPPARFTLRPRKFVRSNPTGRRTATSAARAPSAPAAISATRASPLRASPPAPPRRALTSQASASAASRWHPRPPRSAPAWSRSGTRPPPAVPRPARPAC